MLRPGDQLAACQRIFPDETFGATFTLTGKTRCRPQSADPSAPLSRPESATGSGSLPSGKTQFQTDIAQFGTGTASGHKHPATEPPADSENGAVFTLTLTGPLNPVIKANPPVTD